MTAQAFLDHLDNTPSAWVLVANSVWERAENVTTIALFDEYADVLAYVAASRLPEGVSTKGHRTIHRSFRPDSLLWDFNAEPEPELHVLWAAHAAANRMPVRHLPINPTPPTGSLCADDFPGLHADHVDTVRSWTR